MTVVKIVPMPGVAVEGPRGPQGLQGPQGIQGEPGEGFSATSNPWTPIVSGTGFSQSLNPANGEYTRYGDLVFVHMYVPFSNVTNFGTGQYSVTLPFNSKYHTDVFGGSLHDFSTGRTYTIKGHIDTDSNQAVLSYSSGSLFDDGFDYNSPFLLETNDYFHMSFTYEAVTLP
jgi:hypothetical protein